MAELGKFLSEVVGKALDEDGHRSSAQMPEGFMNMLQFAMWQLKFLGALARKPLDDGFKPVPLTAGMKMEMALDPVMKSIAPHEKFVEELETRAGEIGNYLSQGRRLIDQSNNLDGLVLNPGMAELRVRVRRFLDDCRWFDPEEANKEVKKLMHKVSKSMDALNSTVEDALDRLLDPLLEDEVTALTLARVVEADLLTALTNMETVSYDTKKSIAKLVVDFKGLEKRLSDLTRKHHGLDQPPEDMDAVKAKMDELRLVMATVDPKKLPAQIGYGDVKIVLKS